MVLFCPVWIIQEYLGTRVPELSVISKPKSWEALGSFHCTPFVFPFPPTPHTIWGNNTGCSQMVPTNILSLWVRLSNSSFKRPQTTTWFQTVPSQRCSFQRTTWSTHFISHIIYIYITAFRSNNFLCYPTWTGMVLLYMVRKWKWKYKSCGTKPLLVASGTWNVLHHQVGCSERTFFFYLLTLFGPGGWFLGLFLMS